MRVRRAACALALVGACHPFDGIPVDVTVGDAGALDASTDAPSAPSPEPAPSCKGLLERDGARRDDGVYEIDPDGPGGAPPFPAFCDMTLDGGGWTLVGRSAPAVTGTGQRPLFGWRFGGGSVSDPTKPYSIDVVAARLEFTEVLVADRDRTIAYKFGVARDFLTANAASSVPTGVVTRLLGGCNARDGEPTMLRHTGATSFTDVFFLRDIPDVTQHTGLRADGFELTYDECDQGGLLNERQGMILVR